MTPYIALTFGDHEKNGIHQIAKWPVSSREVGLDLVARFNAAIPPEAVPDLKAEPFTFILDVFDENGDFDQPTNAMAKRLNITDNEKLFDVLTDMIEDSGYQPTLDRLEDEGPTGFLRTLETLT